jgi:hypothetical protein
LLAVDFAAFGFGDFPDDPDLGAAAGAAAVESASRLMKAGASSLRMCPIINCADGASSAFG